MTDFTLDISGNDLSILRNGVVILRGRIDMSDGKPQITGESNGWCIEHPTNADVEDVFDISTSGHWFGGQRTGKSALAE